MVEMDSASAVVILAAGQGTRMKSGRAKVLHEIAGRPMLGFPIAVAKSLAPERLLVVVGRDADQVCEQFAGQAEFIVQAQQRGTGHAVLQTQAALGDFSGAILILYGDTPLLTAETLERMVALRAEKSADLVLLTARLPLPGRIVRDASGRVERIVETTDATPEELELEEGNTGVYLMDADLVWQGLAQADDSNAQGEIYLTDIVSFAVREGKRVEALLLDDADEALGVNNRVELAQADRVWRARTARRLMESGVTIVDPENTYIDVDVEVGPDTRIDPGCVITSGTRIGSRVHVKPHCTIEASQLDDDVQIGPMAHLRPGSHLCAGVRVGNFVEVKNSTLGEGSKANHLTYLGDADVGSGVNIGCGVVTVNYDGEQKHRTVIEDGAFVGCNANLIAPVTVERDAYVAAGSTITQDVPEDGLGVARARQKNIEKWRQRRGLGKKK